VVWRLPDYLTAISHTSGQPLTTFVYHEQNSQMLAFFSLLNNSSHHGLISGKLLKPILKDIHSGDRSQRESKIWMNNKRSLILAHCGNRGSMSGNK
jgi:hypothetical protein